jgi:pyruvate formate lyase activating enzyme
MTPEAMDMIGPYLDAWRVDIKGFSDEFYRKLAKIHKWRGILDVAVRAKTKWQMHVEVVTNIIPTMNDDDAQLKSLAAWIHSELGELTPWHVTRFYPHYHFQHLPPTPIETLERAYDIGKAEGLRFIYTGNVPGHDKENTYCYSCGRLVLRRAGYSARVEGIENSKCSFCGADLNVRME